MTGQSCHCLLGLFEKSQGWAVPARIFSVYTLNKWIVALAAPGDSKQLERPISYK